MKKILTLFKRDVKSWLVVESITPGAEWVIAGEGIATQKLDGTCCMIDDVGNLWKRYERDAGQEMSAAMSVWFVPADDIDPITGKQPGWLPCLRENPENRWHIDAFDRLTASGIPIKPWTYELCGPKVQGNPEGFSVHVLCPHGGILLDPATPRDFAGLLEYFTNVRNDIEGIVWHHLDGRMVKIKAKDFGLRRKTVAVSYTESCSKMGPTEVKP